VRGGILAWEIARRLSAAGERVDLLALLDTPWPPDWRRRLRSRFQWLLPPGGDYLLRRAARHVRALKSLPVAQWTAYLRGKSGAALAALRQADPEGWATLAGSIEVVRVPGDHTTYLGDHVDEVAAILGRWLGTGLTASIPPCAGPEEEGIRSEGRASAAPGNSLCAPARFNKD
jgi:thioesterase domain-containing protein